VPELEREINPEFLPWEIASIGWNPLTFGGSGSERKEWIKDTKI
jgi:hypothetical protein